MQKFILQLLIIGAAINICAQVPDVEKVKIKISLAAGAVHMLEGAGGNIGVIAGDDGLFLVDDQYAPLSEKIMNALKTLGKESAKFVINTHWHFDHTGGNENFGKTGSIIVAHENVRRRMSTDQLIEAFDWAVEASPKGALPVITFTSDVTFHFNGEEIHVFHVDPAHTDGDAIVHFKNSNVVHMGDTFFNGFYPFIDVSSGGNIKGMIAASEKVLAMIDDETKIIPGHGPLADKQVLKTYHAMLVNAHSEISAMIKDGKTIDEIKAAKPFAKTDPDWGGGFINPDKFAEILYSDLARKK